MSTKLAVLEMCMLQYNPRCGDVSTSFYAIVMSHLWPLRGWIQSGPVVMVDCVVYSGGGPYCGDASIMTQTKRNYTLWSLP